MVRQPSESPVASWRRRHSLRLAVYVLGVVVGCAAVVVIVRSCCRETGFLTKIAGSGTLHQAASQIGVRYSVGSVRACLSEGRSWTAELRNIDLGFAGQPLLIHTDTIELSPRGVSLGPIAIGTTAAPRVITVQRVTSDLLFHKIETQGAEILIGAAPTDSSLSTRLVTMTGLSLPRPADGTLELGRVAVEDVETTLQSAPNGAWNFDGLVSMRALLDSLATRPLVSFDGLYRVLLRLRTLLAWGAVGAAVLLVILKVAAVRNLRLGIGMALPVVAAVILPVPCYLFLVERLSLQLLAVFALTASLFAALFLARTIYREGKEWHQRWEPFLLDLAAVPVLLPILVIHGLIPNRPVQVPSIKVVEASVRNVGATVRDSQIGDGVLANISLPKVDANDLSVAVDPASAQLRSVNVGRASFAGVLTAGLPSSLNDIRWLPRGWFGLRTIALCGSLRDSVLPPAGQPEPCGTGGADSASIVTNLAAKVTLAPLGASYALETRVRASGLGLTIDARGDQRFVQIRKIESLPGSAVEIGNGAGIVALNGGFAASLILSRLRLAAFAALESIESRVTIRSFSTPTTLDSSVDLRGVTVTTKLGRAVLSRCLILLRQGAGRVGPPVSLRASVRGLTLTGRRLGEMNNWLTAELPSIKLEVTGQTTGALAAGGFDGEVRTQIEGGAEGTVFETSAPVRFATDVRQGTFELAEQPIVVHQTVFPQAPPELALRLSTTGRLLSITSPLQGLVQAHCVIPRLVPDVLPMRAEINGIDISLTAALGVGASGAHVRYSSGWSTITLPASPRAVELKDASQLIIESEGALPTLPLPVQLLNIVAPALKRLSSLRESLQSKVTFKVAGAWPPAPRSSVLQVQSFAGAGVRVGSFGLGLEKVEIQDATLRNLEVSTEASDIQTIDGRGDLKFRAGLALSGEALDVTASVPLGSGEHGLAFTLHRVPSGVDFRLDEPLASSALMAPIDPFLREFGLNLDGMASRAQIDRLRAAARFSGTDLNAIDLDVHLAPGPLASFDFRRLLPAQPSGFLRQMDVAIESRGKSDGLRLSLESSTGDPKTLPIKVKVEGGPLSMKAVGTDNREYRVGTSLNAQLDAVLYSEAPPQPPLILDRLLAAASGFGWNLQKVVRAFAIPLSPEGATGLHDISWRAMVRGGAPQTPVVLLNPDEYRIAFSTDIKELAWSVGQTQQRSRIIGTSEVEADLRTDGDDLIADGQLPIDLHLVMAGMTPRHIAARVPFAILVAPQLRAAPPGSELLWDHGYYDSFWETHAPAHAIGSTAVLDAREVILGPLSIHQIAIPARSFRIAIGYADGLDVDVPVASEALYGSIGGGFQARVRWRGDDVPSAVVDTRLNLQLANLQASALGFASDEGHAPAVEDQVNGTFGFDSDGLGLNRKLLGNLMAGSLDPAQLDTLSVRAELRSSPTDRQVPGTFQAMTGVRLDLLNSVLKQLARDLHLTVPPRALQYDSLALDFQAAHGKVLPDHSAFELRGLKLYSAQGLDVDGTFRVHLGTPADPYPLRSLIFLAQRLISAIGVGEPGQAQSGLRVILRRHP